MMDSFEGLRLTLFWLYFKIRAIIIESGTLVSLILVYKTVCFDRKTLL